MRALALLGLIATIGTADAGAQAPDGKQVFETHCRKCHGAAGQPTPAIRKLFPEIPVWDAAFFATRTTDGLMAVLMEGKGKNMKSFKAVLTPEEAAAVTRYILTLAPPPSTNTSMSVGH